MRNITLAIEDDVLERARIVAAKKRTTVNAAVRSYLEAFAAEEDRAADSQRRLTHLMDNPSGSLGKDFKWDREALYDD